MFPRASSRFDAFASPDHGVAERASLLAAARRARATRIVSSVLARGRSVLPQTVTVALERLPHAAADDSANVDRALSHLAGGLLEDGVSSISSALRAAVATSSDVTFAAELSVPIRLRWRGVITAPIVAVRYDPAARDTLHVRLRSGKEVAVLAGDPSATAAPRARLGSKTVDLIPAWALDVHSCFEGGLEPSPLETSVFEDQLASAAQYLAAAAPEYLSWVEEVTADIFPIDGRDGILRSRSNPVAPGRIAVSFPAAPIALAELLIHEASHQYLDLARELGPLDDGSDQRLYWSPAKRLERPIDRILAAFHAWANMSAFFERCLHRNLDLDGYAARNLPVVQKDLRELKSSLEQTPALTEIGHALWTPFCDTARA